MLTFNDLLRHFGVDPAVVRLLRHRHRVHQAALYADAIAGDDAQLRRFEAYQSDQAGEQTEAKLRSAEVLAAFVVDPRGDTVFIGLWRVLEIRGEHTPDPYWAEAPPSRESCFTLYTARLDELRDLRGRLVIDWGSGERAWIQYADRQDKPVLEIKRVVTEEPFPGVLGFQHRLAEVGSMWPSWIERLRELRGVYLLVHRKTGQQYVGSATGSDGFFGRWISYADGHGGNVAMRQLEGRAEDYDVAVLETAGSSATPEDIVERESEWKKKLGCRVHGLNRN